MPRPLPPTTSSSPSFFFFNDTATTEIYTLSLHDALPISSRSCGCSPSPAAGASRRSGFSDRRRLLGEGAGSRDRKSTRLNSSHSQISYAVFCLKKKKNRENHIRLEPYNQIH